MLNNPSLPLRQLNIRARDQGSPEQFGSTVAIITILRDQASPNFVQLPYRTTVQRSTAINSTVVRATAVDADLQVSQPLSSLQIAV